MKSFDKWLKLTEEGKLEHPNLEYIGHVAVFYIPEEKLDDEKYGKEGKTPKEFFQDYFIKHYNAYTLDLSDTVGFWRKSSNSKVHRDKNARYEVSFKGFDRIPKFIDFLSEMCSLIDEENIYLTMGYKSWLVSPSSTTKTEKK